ncbi:MAG: DNA mismatch repair endonuclease MutL [Candidatus Omnitrophota bacterium]|nr:DNA mismatch repair endonuclease MutL [Candidatus Omnitrophota bacterium]
MKTMAKVHILPPELVSKIAAGEVVERPASCVKELIENSLDANAEKIEISLKNSGKSSITVKDTGTGIEPDDIKKLFIRHATSKIQGPDDLFQIRSLGFRGEALYSISAVADVTLRSKTESNNSGWEIHLRGGEKKGLKPVSMQNGTQIEVKELFFNTPARKKFLKTDTTELQQILNLFLPYTLLYPERHFTLSHNNRTIMDLLPNKNHVERIQKALNLAPEHIIEVKKEFPEQNLSIHLLFSDINIQRARKDLQFIFINNRPVQNHILSFHINQVYRLLLPSGVKPFFAIYLTMPPENLDVNIHPTKREVKIKNEPYITQLLRTLCEHVLMSHGKPKEMRGITLPGTKDKTPLASESSKFSGASGEKYPSMHERQIVFDQKAIPTPLQAAGLKHQLSIANYIGSFLHKYLFFESGTSLLVIDQHAAQERITYEKLIGQVESGHIEIQRLLTPFVISLSPQEKIVWEKTKENLEKIGLETSPWEKENIALHTHPQLIKKPEIAIRNILSEVDTKLFDPDLIARRACRDSLMAGDKISSQEATALRDRLIACKDPFVCPHQRPTVIEIKESTFERQFLRK